MEAVVALGCIALKGFVDLPSYFEVSKVIYHLPYFVLGRYLIKLLYKENADKDWLNVGLFVVSITLFVVLDKMYLSTSGFIILKYLRAVMMILTIYVVAHYLLKWADTGNKVGSVIEQFLNNCSKYSLQLYLFNGFILVGVRTVLVTMLHITEPVVIVSSLVFFNLLITLLICNYLLPKSKWLSWLCGTGDRPWK